MCGLKKATLTTVRCLSGSLLTVEDHRKSISFVFAAHQPMFALLRRKKERAAARHGGAE